MGILLVLVSMCYYVLLYWGFQETWTSMMMMFTYHGHYSFNLCCPARMHYTATIPICYYWNKIVGHPYPPSLFGLNDSQNIHFGFPMVCYESWVWKSSSFHQLGKLLSDHPLEFSSKVACCLSVLTFELLQHHNLGILLSKMLALLQF